MKKDLFSKIRKYAMQGMVIAMLFSLTACGHDGNNNSGNNEASESTAKEDSNPSSNTNNDKTEDVLSSSEWETYQKVYEDNENATFSFSIEASGNEFE